MREPSLSERVRKPWKQLIDASTKPQVKTKIKKNPSRARVSGNRCIRSASCDSLSPSLLKKLEKIEIKLIERIVFQC